MSTPGRSFGTDFFLVVEAKTALAEIRHFLRSDPRLPAKTRHAVQFLDGLRGEMVLAHKEASHPQYFDCPFVATDVRQYTFKEVRQKFGDEFDAEDDDGEDDEADPKPRYASELCPSYSSSSTLDCQLP